MGIERFGEEINEVVDEGSIEKIDNINVAEIHSSNQQSSSDNNKDLSGDEYKLLWDGEEQEENQEQEEIDSEGIGDFSDEDLSYLWDGKEQEPEKDEFEEIEPLNQEDLKILEKDEYELLHDREEEPEEAKFERDETLDQEDRAAFEKALAFSKEEKESEEKQKTSETPSPLSSDENHRENLEYLAEDTTPAEEDISVIGKKENTPKTEPQKKDASAPSKARREWNKEENMIAGYDEKGQPDGKWYLFEKGKLIQMYTFKAGKLEGPQIIFDENECPDFVAYANGVDMKDMESLDFQNASMKDRLTDYARQAHLEKQKLSPDLISKVQQNANFSINSGLNSNILLSVGRKGGR